MSSSVLSAHTPSLKGMSMHHLKMQSWLQNLRRTRSLSPSARRSTRTTSELGENRRPVLPSTHLMDLHDSRQTRDKGLVTYAVIKDSPRLVRFCPEVQFFRYPLVGLVKARPQRLPLNDKKASRGRLTSPTRASPRAPVRMDLQSMDQLYGPNPMPRLGFRL
jgi:hypothetical protein